MAGLDILKFLAGQRKLSLFIFILLIVLYNLANPVAPVRVPSEQESIDSLVSETALMIVLDTSLTMDRVDSTGQSRLSRAVVAIASLLTKVQGRKIVGLRTFSTFTKLVIKPPLDQNIDVPDKMSEIESLASSNIGAALRAAGEDIANFRKETNNLIPWTLILITDGKGDNPDKDSDAARELKKRYPDLHSHLIGIDVEVPSSEADDLVRLGFVFSGKSWYPKSREFSAAFDAATFLAGFKKQSPEIRKLLLTESKSLNMPLIAFISLAAMVLVFRTRVSEGKFIILLSAFGAVSAWICCFYLLPGISAGSNHSVEGEYYVYFAILRTMGDMAVYFMVIGTILGLIMLASEKLYIGSVRGAVEKVIIAFPIAMWGGMAAGVLAQLVFLLIREGGVIIFGWLYGIDTIVEDFDNYLIIYEWSRVISRSVGWGLGGAIIGACPGVAADSVEKLKNGLIGGICGGLIGGYFFENYYLLSFVGQYAALVALVITAIAIAIMIRVVQEYRKEAWLVIEKGGPTGKSFIIDKANTLLGSHYKCDVVVGKKVGVDACVEAEIITDGKIYTIKPSYDGQVMINDEVVGSHQLCQGDIIEVAAGKLSFHCRFSQVRNSKIEEDLILPKTHDPKQKAAKVNKTDDFTENLKSDVDDDDDGDCIMEIGPLEVAGRKIEES